MKLINTFTIIFVLAAFASLFQLGSLGNGISQSFANAVITSPTSIPTATPAPVVSFKPERVTIPVLKADHLVIAQPLKNGTYDVLPGSVNYAQGTDIVSTQGGNVGLFVDANVKGYENAAQLQANDQIIVNGNNKNATYRVTTVTVAPNDNAFVYNSTKDATLTLVIVNKTFAQKVYVIKAKLQGVEDNK